MTTRAFPAAAALLALCACGGSELGECDEPAARELVYSASGMVATKGQALAHDTCGNGVFCHSAAARGGERHGAPGGMDFDMLPSPRGLAALLERADEAWGAVESGEMPPRGPTSAVLGDGRWSVSIDGDPGAPALPPLTSVQGKAIFRNWLACGAPTVTETLLPPWSRPPSDPFDGGAAPSGQDIYRAILAPKCALAGCHNAGSAAGGLALRDACQSRAALLGQGACGERYVRPGDADGSFLMNKLEADAPRCGGPMPPPSHGGRLPEAYRSAIAAWIDGGAEVEGCP